jgi:hypothetical protein
VDFLEVEAMAFSISSKLTMKHPIIQLTFQRERLLSFGTTATSQKKKVYIAASNACKKLQCVSLSQAGKASGRKLPCWR